MKRLFCALTLLTLVSISCGPAAEDKSQMHARAQVIADSMANLIKTAMAEAEMPNGQQVLARPVDSTAAKQNTATTK